MDLVYVVGKNNLWGEHELRFSLRSAEKYLQFDRVIIVGHKPTFLNSKVINIYLPDDKGHKYLNVAYKIRELLKNKEISDDFIFMNDDFFLLKPFPVIPYYFNKTIKEWIERYPFNKGKYYEQIEELYKAFPEGKFFETHFPIIYNKKMASDVIEKYQLKLTLMLRSFYCNEYIDKISPVEETKDYKIYNHHLITKTFIDVPFVSSTNEISANSDFKNMMTSRFPQKSKYEG